LARTVSCGLHLAVRERGGSSQVRSATPDAPDRNATIHARPELDADGAGDGIRAITETPALMGDASQPESVSG